MSDRTKLRKSNPSSPSSSSSSSSQLKPQTLTLTLMSPRLFILPSIFFFSLSFFLLTIFSFSHSSLPPSPPPLPSSPKLYLYKTPPLFTSSIIQNYHLSRSRDPALLYPGHQHSAEFHLLADLLIPARPLSSPLRLVADPAQADLFFVPFFSSLSLIVNRPNSSSNVVYDDEEMQERVVSWVEGQEYWGRNGGRDHVFVCQDPNAMYRVIDRVRNAVLLVSDFGRLRGGSVVKDVVLPYAHRINRFGGEVGVEGRDALLFFMGNRYRKEDPMYRVIDSIKNGVLLVSHFGRLRGGSVVKDVVLPYTLQINRFGGVWGLRGRRHCCFLWVIGIAKRCVFLAV